MARPNVVKCEKCSHQWYQGSTEGQTYDDDCKECGHKFHGALRPEGSQYKCECPSCDGKPEACSCGEMEVWSPTPHWYWWHCPKCLASQEKGGE